MVFLRRVLKYPNGTFIRPKESCLFPGTTMIFIVIYLRSLALLNRSHEVIEWRATKTTKYYLHRRQRPCSVTAINIQAL